ncbi:HAMP domain-containing protein [Desulfonispora thiosulfatigenes DSM 11270]|uniref:histidine kinase n=1 Tax=Desulfonispora thiosulfatigenes DSM 11270 TaxID=656914 RepID=A0A1W1UPB2_DESTI|nr:HAMP domain-containing protein [Desulfonispora thiosulfatigenes DSM 11270]
MVTLLIGLILIGIISTLFIKNSTIKKRIDIMHIFASEIADIVIDNNGQMNINFKLARIIEKRDRFLKLDKGFIMVLDKRGQIVYGKSPIIDKIILDNTFLSLEDTEHYKKIKFSNNKVFYQVTHKIETVNNETLGWVIMLNPERSIIKSPEEMKLLVMMLIGLAILGWLVIYLLTRKLSRPIMDLKEAMNKVDNGNYDIHLDNNHKQKEIYELMNSFEQMTIRLKSLERLRTELLAGITHELKTPVTSISALLQAMKDGVVSKEEENEFLEMCYEETNRLEKMIEDLLDYNSFAVGAIKVDKEKVDINLLIKEITYQWHIGQEDVVEVNTVLLEKSILIQTDPNRIRQILYNLLNNAKQALRDKGKIEIIMHQENNEIRIDIKDNGRGIPLGEQDLIFERFYRGKEKMDNIRGLGLGLASSKLMAQELGGDLILKESSIKGTIFTLIIAKPTKKTTFT